MVEEGRLRYYGISTNSLEVLKKFNRHGTCSVVQVDYSLLNRQPEEEFLPYCEQEGIAVMVRGPLAKGLLSGRYDLDSVFADDVRAGFNRGEAGRARSLPGPQRGVDPVPPVRPDVELPG